MQLTTACNIVTLTKTFHSSSGDECISTNAVVMRNIVMTDGIRSTDVLLFQTLIDILKKNERTEFSFFNELNFYQI